MVSEILMNDHQAWSQKTGIIRRAWKYYLLFTNVIRLTMFFPMERDI